MTTVLFLETNTWLLLVFINLIFGNFFAGEGAGAESSSSTRDVQSKTPEIGTGDNSKPQEGGDFFSDWLSSPKAAKESAGKPTDRPKTERLTEREKRIRAKKLSESSRKTSSSSLSDAESKDVAKNVTKDVKDVKEAKPVKDVKETKPVFKVGSDSAFKTVSSQDSLLATSGSSSAFEELQVDPSKGDEDVFKQFSMDAEVKKAEAAHKENEYSPLLRVKSKDDGEVTKQEKEN